MPGTAPGRYGDLPYLTPCNGLHAYNELTGRRRKDPSLQQAERFRQSRPCAPRHDAVPYRREAVVVARGTVASGCLWVDQRRITPSWELSAVPSAVTAPFVKTWPSTGRRLQRRIERAAAVRGTRRRCDSLHVTRSHSREAQRHHD